jgi:hypothetical protein
VTQVRKDQVLEVVLLYWRLMSQSLVDCGDDSGGACAKVVVGQCVISSTRK